jgi:hypothetical protein
MVAPVTVPLILYRNADYGETFYFEDENGAAVDFTGYVGAFEIRRYERAPGPALLTGAVDCTIGNGGIELTAAFESIATLPAPATRGGITRLFYDLRLTTPSGDKEDWMRGPVSVFGGVTTA